MGTEEGRAAYVEAFRNVAFETIQSKAPSNTGASFYHYTSAEGLKGIVEENTLRFSDTKFVNDGSERQWGLDRFGEILNELRPTFDKRTEEFLDKAFEKEKGFSEEFRQVVFCMSSRGNLLNQWRDYGKGVVPYCIEFDAGFFYKSWGPDKAQKAAFDPSISKLIYRADVQTELIKELINRLLGVARPRWDGMSTEEFDDLATTASFQIGILLQNFKNSAFEAEEEVRLYQSHFGIKAAKISPKFRASGLGLIPYYEWTPSEKLPIKSVMVGPSPHAQASLDALDVFLKATGTSASSSVSNIPIRTF